MRGGRWTIGITKRCVDRFRTPVPAGRGDRRCPPRHPAGPTAAGPGRVRRRGGGFAQVHKDARTAPGSVRKAMMRISATPGRPEREKLVDPGERSRTSVAGGRTMRRFGGGLRASE